MNVDVDLNLPKTGREYLRKLRAKEITIQEFDEQIAYWTIQHIDSMRWKPSPSMPAEVAEYMSNKQRDSKYTVSDSFWQQDHIKAWRATDVHIRCENSGNWHWLQELKRCIPKADVPAHSKIAKVMASYPSWDRKYIV